MINLTNEHEYPEYLLKEWEELDAVIRPTEELLERLRLRRSEVETAVDEITRPAAMYSTPSERHIGAAECGGHEQASVVPEKPMYLPRGFEYRGQYHTAIDKIDIHKMLLRLLLEDYPDKEKLILREFQSIGRTRKYLSHDRFDLFNDKPREWVLQHSEVLIDGWCIDTNLNETTMVRILKAAVAAVNAKWGVDVVVRWRSRWFQAT